MDDYLYFIHADGTLVMIGDDGKVFRVYGYQENGVEILIETPYRQ